MLEEIFLTPNFVEERVKLQLHAVKIAGFKIHTFVFTE